MTTQHKPLALFETQLGATLAVYSEMESHMGKTLVTLASDETGLGSALFPAEARELAKALLRAADLAEGV